LGFTGCFRGYIPNYGLTAAPLTDLTKKNTAFHWSVEQQQAFDTLRKELTSIPVLRNPDFENKFIVCTDASTKGIGAVLMQDFAERRAPSCLLLEEIFGCRVKIFNVRARAVRINCKRSSIGVRIWRVLSLSSGPITTHYGSCRRRRNAIFSFPFLYSIVIEKGSNQLMYRACLFVSFFRVRRNRNGFWSVRTINSQDEEKVSFVNVSFIISFFRGLNTLESEREDADDARLQTKQFWRTTGSKKAR